MISTAEVSKLAYREMTTSTHITTSLFYVTDREKTLVDAPDCPDLSGGIAQLAQALRAARADLRGAERNDGRPV